MRGDAPPVKVSAEVRRESNSMPATYNQPEIDFLPADYRKRHSKRNQQRWRIAVAGGILAIVAATALLQGAARRSLAREAENLDAPFRECTRKSEELAALQVALAKARTQAELFTTIRLSWPTTQIIAAVVDPLPESTTLEQLQLVREQAADHRVATAAHAESRRDPKLLAKQSPTQQDLDALRASLASSEVVVTITGLSTDLAALHRYVGELEQSRLFRSAQLESVQQVTEGARPADRCRIRCVLRDPTGMGETPAKEKLASTTSHATT